MGQEQLSLQYLPESRESYPSQTNEISHRRALPDLMLSVTMEYSSPPRPNNAWG